MVSAGRFGQGMTFDQYVAYTATPENLKREASMAGARRDWSGLLREVYATTRLSDAQRAAWQWLTAQPGGPARVLARVADTAGLELRIFPRDGQRFSSAPEPDPRESPNADLMAQYLNRRDGQTFQSIPVIVFFARDMRELYRYVEFPLVYHKDRIRAAQTAAKPGESAEQTRERATREFMELQASPFFSVWRDAAQAEWISMLYEQLRVGSLP